MEWAVFSITDVDMVDTSHQPEHVCEDEELSFGYTPLPTRQQPEELGRGKHVKKSKMCGTGGHLRRQK
ncbi:unnamed protein product [Lathyrus sativus]|nr:unnamed protein product [Lathyrus sativus]